MPVAERSATRSIAQSMLTELEAQVPITRRFLERVPGDKLTWKPHERSLTAGQLALHLAAVPAGILQLVQNNPAVARNAFVFPQPASREEILQTLDESMAAARKLLPQTDDAAMQETWRLVDSDGKELMALSRGAFLRDVMLSHWYQHRGQMSVYLRLLNVPVPASFGPSGDEPPPFLQKG